MVRRKASLLVIILSFFSLSLTLAQTVQGTLLSVVSGEPIVGASVDLEGKDLTAMTNAQGVFRIFDVPAGTYMLKISEQETAIEYGVITVGQEDLDLGSMKIASTASTAGVIDINIITLDDGDLDLGDRGGASTSSLLNASRDPFINAAAFNLSVGRFNQRGYGQEDQQMYLNGFMVNDLDDGRVGWATWGGLNDILRVQEGNFDLDASQFSFGGMLGARNIDLSASVQRPQTKLVLNRTNRSYQNRAMITHSSGEQANGWAYTISASRRWGDSGFTPGTFHDSYAYAVLVDKRINDKHLLNFVALGSPTKRGRNGVSIQEVYDLAGTNYYNPNWGLQNGEVRNSAVSKIHQPFFMLRHDWNITDDLIVKTTIGYQTGEFSNSRLDWADAPDPRPDYYRKLPSFQLTEGLQQQVADYYREDPLRLQVNFDEMILTNKNSFLTFDNVNGTNESLSGAFSRYVIEEQHFDNEKFNINTVVNAFVNEHYSVQGGVNYLIERNSQYRELADLLGGEYYIDFDRFAERDFPDRPEFLQSDLQNPNRIVAEGDRYGWNFDIVTDRAELWQQNNFSYDKVDFFVAGSISTTSFYREGYYQNGRFPDSSLGKGETYRFVNPGVKAGLTYKIDGRNYAYARGSYRTRAPFSRNAFLSPRTRDQVAGVLNNETILGTEVGYVFRYPGVKGRITAYYSEFNDQLRSRNIYFEATNSFGNYLLQGIDEKHQGIEMGAEIKLSSTLTATVAGNIGAFQYNSRPTSGFTADNDAINPDLIATTDNEIFIQNYYLPGPQNAGSIGIEYRSPKFWFVNITGNFFNNINLDLFPERRTNAAVSEIVVPDRAELVDQIIGQYDLKDQFVLNLFAGKSWRVKDYYVLFNVSVNNVLNNREFITGGFEQFRYRDQEPNAFPERLFYAWGTNYSAGLTISLN